MVTSVIAPVQRPHIGRIARCAAGAELVIPLVASRDDLDYRPELDGVRTVAVYLVLLYHAGMPSVAGGFVGVDLFFVLSGFLVSKSSSARSTNGAACSLGGSTRSRVRRLLPAAVLVIVLTEPASVLMTTIVRRLPMSTTRRAHCSTSPTGTSSRTSNDYFAAEVDQEPVPALLVALDRGAVLPLLPAPPPRCRQFARWLDVVDRARDAAGLLGGLPVLLVPVDPSTPTTAPTPGCTSCWPAPCLRRCCAALGHPVSPRSSAARAWYFFCSSPAD